MKVWLLYDGSDIIAAYRTQELGEHYMEKHIQQAIEHETSDEALVRSTVNLHPIGVQDE